MDIIPIRYNRLLAVCRQWYDGERNLTVVSWWIFDRIE
jgi:hypothetical protein